MRFPFGRVTPVLLAAALGPSPLARADGFPPSVATECVDGQGVIDDGSHDPSCDPEWALKETGFTRAKNTIRERRDEEPGQGIVIASLDTGYTNHPELAGVRFELDRGYTFKCDEGYDAYRVLLPGVCPPEDRLALDTMEGGFPFLYQPGHGTGTISVLASPDGAPVAPTPNTGAHVSGAVPGARVVPMRAIDGVILSEGRAWNLARAIIRVLLEDPDGREPEAPAVDVISISLGRRAPYSHLEKAVQLAERRGVVVVAAAGQGPPLTENRSVRFPGNYPSVTAVTGIDVNTRPWRFGTASGVDWLFSAGRGKGVDVAAPAVNVWRAETARVHGVDEYRVGRGTGTSFATPLVAGAAAVWLQWYGRENLQARYGRPAISAAFQLHLKTRGVRSPIEMAELARELGLPNADRIAEEATNPWDKTSTGAGILAVDRLIEPAFEALPTRAAVCQSVYALRGAEGLATVCPPRECPADVHADCANDTAPSDKTFDQTLIRPEYHIDPRNAYVVSVTAGAPFGFDTGAWYAPVVSVGLLRGRHQYRSTRGLFIQAKGGEHGIGGGIGWAAVEEYGPHRNEEDKFATIPGFGVLLGFSARLSYLRTEETNHIGAEIGIGYTRAKLNLGLYRALGDDPPETWRFTLDGGFGF